MIARKQEIKRIDHGKNAPIMVSFFSVFVGVLLMNGVVAQEAGDAAVGLPGVAQKEVLRRQAQVRKMQALVQEADFEYSERNYAKALGLYVSAFEGLDRSPASTSLREGVFQRYQTAAVKYARQLISGGQYKPAEKLLADAMAAAKDSGLNAGVVSPDLRKLLGQVRDDDHFNKARTPMLIKDEAEVKQLLKIAQGHADLGRFDEATQTYAQVLAIDSYNEAARRGMENVDRLVMDYYSAARNQTRASMLQKVSRAWELPVPHKVKMSGLINDSQDIGFGAQAASIQEKLVNTVIPNIEFEGARLIDVITFLVQKSQELDVKEPDPAKKGVNIVVDPGTGPAVNEMPVDIKLSNVPLGEVLRYVASRAGLKSRIESYAVRLVALSDVDETAMVTKRYQVPPGFIRGGGEGGGDAAAADPFAEPAGGGDGTLVTRVTAKDFLIQNGVIFPTGALAQFIPSTSTLLVRNTPANLDLIESMVISSRSEGAKVIKIDFRMITVSENKLNELGFDWLLGASDVTGTVGVFSAGGTRGNSNPVPSSEYPFVNPFTGVVTGQNPVTAGNRSGNVKTTLSIDDILESNAGSVPAAGGGITNAPGIFSVAGVFTDPQFQVVIRALDQQKGVDRICDASVVTRSGDKAVIREIREFIYPTEYDPPEIPNTIGLPPPSPAFFVPDTIPVVPANPTAFEMRELGKVLDVTPTLGADNLTVGLEIVSDVSDFIGFINYGVPIRGGRDRVIGGPYVITENRIVMPVFEAVKETTSVTVWDGQTVAIGGLIGEVMTKVDDKIPFIGDLPGVGRLFRSSIEQRSRKAIIMFVSVRVLDPSGAPLNKTVATRE